MLQLNVNGQRHEVAMDGDTPLLWVLRDGLKLTGTGFTCDIVFCGSCVVPVDGKPASRPSLLPWPMPCLSSPASRCAACQFA